MLRVRLVTCFLLTMLHTGVYANTIADWPSVGGQPGGGHYSSATDITPKNVHQLKKVWQFNTGDKSEGSDTIAKTTFEATPILFKRHLVFCTPFNRVIALDPVNGSQHWQYDPKLNAGTLKTGTSEGSLICRGVTSWQDTQAHETAECKYRIFTATQDARLISLDAETGKPCSHFGNGGTVDTRVDYDYYLDAVRLKNNGVPDNLIAKLTATLISKYGNTSAPAVAGDTVVIGSQMPDNWLSTMMPGLVRGYDARSGKLKWTFNPIPFAMRDKTGAANTWAPISVDVKRQLVFIATGSASPDFYGANRIENIPYANAIVALDANTGKVKWHFKTIHHDLFDYDLPAQPTLVEFKKDGVLIPAVIQPTKTGMLYVLNELTGEPLHPIEEVKVPQTDVPGEKTSLTQPRPILPAPLFSDALTEDDIWGLTPIDRYMCLRTFRKLRYEGIFTPPSIKGTLQYPMSGGGFNWGGISYDPNTNIIVANYSRLAQIVKLIPREQTNTDKLGDSMFGTPYRLSRELFVSPLGVPCVKPPWGKIAAIDLYSGKVLWERPYGSVKKGFFRTPQKWGSPIPAGSMVTKSGLIFIGASADWRFRALDLKSGETLWTAELPAIAHSNPMTYRIDGKQYVVITAGGLLGVTAGKHVSDAVVAFALP